MVVNCGVYNCRERFKKGSPIAFHSLPADPERRQAWIDALRGNITVSASAKVCSKHFSNSCFDVEKLGGRWLKKSAVPTIFGFSSQGKTIAPPFSKSTPVQTFSSSTQTDSEAETRKPVKDFSGQTECLTPMNKVRAFRYVGDYKDDLIYDLEIEKRRWIIAKKTMDTQKKKIKCLMLNKRRLEKKLEMMRKEVDEIKGIKVSDQGTPNGNEKSSEATIKAEMDQDVDPEFSCSVSEGKVKYELDIKIEKDDSSEDCEYEEMLNSPIEEEVVVINKLNSSSMGN